MADRLGEAAHEAMPQKFRAHRRRNLRERRDFAVLTTLVQNSTAT
jgi:hypothetical protein